MEDTGGFAADRAYFAQRAAEELELALSASDHEASEAHRKLQREAQQGRDVVLVRRVHEAAELAASHRLERLADERREARDVAIDLGDDHLAVGDLRRREVDGIGVRQQLVSIFRKLERRPALQILERAMLLRPGEPQSQALSAI